MAIEERRRRRGSYHRFHRAVVGPLAFVVLLGVGALSAGANGPVPPARGAGAGALSAGPTRLASPDRDLAVTAGLSSGVYRRGDGDGAVVGRLDLRGAWAFHEHVAGTLGLPAALVHSWPGEAAGGIGTALGNLALGVVGWWPGGAGRVAGTWFEGGFLLSLPTASRSQAAADAEALFRTEAPGAFERGTQLAFHLGAGVREGPRRVLGELAVVTIAGQEGLQVDDLQVRVRASAVVGPKTVVLGAVSALLEPSWTMLSSLEVGYDWLGRSAVIGPRLTVPLIFPELGLIVGLVAGWP